VPGYDVFSVPPVGDSVSSRFAVATSPGGWGTSPSTNVAAVASQLIARLVAEAPPALPPSKTVSLKRVRPTNNGTFELIDRGTVTGVPTLASRVPGKFSRLTSSAGALIDELLLGAGSGFESARDDDLWEALKETCETLGAGGEEARSLSDAVAIAVLCRHGLSVRRDRLPS
jgi:hypothetical protein